MKIFLNALFILVFSISAFSQTPISKVDSYIEHGEYYKAEKTIKKEYAKDSTNIEYYYYMGKVDRNLGLYDAAMDYFNRALKIDSNAANVIVQVGIEYAQKWDTSKAILLINHAIKLAPTNWDCYNALGGVLLVMNRSKQALDCFLKAFELNPNSFIVQYNLGDTYYDLNDYEKAIYYLSISLVEKKDRLAYDTRANAYYEQDKYKEAMDDYTSALKLKDSKNPYEHKGDGKLYYWRAKCWKELGNTSKYDSDMKLAKENGYSEK